MPRGYAWTQPPMKRVSQIGIAEDSSQCIAASDVPDLEATRHLPSKLQV